MSATPAPAGAGTDPSGPTWRIDVGPAGATMVYPATATGWLVVDDADPVQVDPGEVVPVMAGQRLRLYDGRLSVVRAEVYA